jgi:hypothetical protein
MIEVKGKRTFVILGEDEIQIGVHKFEEYMNVEALIFQKNEEPLEESTQVLVVFRSSDHVQQVINQLTVIKSDLLIVEEKIKAIEEAEQLRLESEKESEKDENPPVKKRGRKKKA